MHAKRINENEVINLKESKKVYVGLEGGKEWKNVLNCTTINLRNTIKIIQKSSSPNNDNFDLFHCSYKPKRGVQECFLL